MKKENKGDPNFKIVKSHGKTFKIVPSIKYVEGQMLGKDFLDDLKAGIKYDIKDLVAIAMAGTKNIKGFFDTYVVKASAYCDEHDEWDEKIGMDVCAAKMELKNHLKLAKRYHKASDNLVEASHVADDLAIKHETKAMSIEEDLQKYYGRLAL